MADIGIINLSNEYWENPRRARKQLLFESLLKTEPVGEVLYLNPFRYLWKTCLSDAEHISGMRVLSFGYPIRGDKYRIVRELNRILIYNKLKKEMRHRDTWHTFLYNPTNIFLSRKLSGRGPVLFDWTDDWAKFYNNKSFLKDQERAIKLSDGVIVVSNKLAERAKEISRSAKVLVLPNATAWSPDANPKMPGKIKEIPEPRIGYIGLVGGYLNLELVRCLVERMAEWHWVMIGYVDGKIKAGFSGYNNIHFMGETPYHLIQAYLDQCHVLVAPYHDNLDSDSTKLYDYLTTGLPIISSKIETAERLYPYVRVAKGVEEWLQAIKEELGSNNETLSEERKKESLKNTWDIRALKLVEWMDSLRK